MSWSDQEADVTTTYCECHILIMMGVAAMDLKSFYELQSSSLSSSHPIQLASYRVIMCNFPFDRSVSSPGTKASRSPLHPKTCRRFKSSKKRHLAHARGYFSHNLMSNIHWRVRAPYPY